MTTDIAIVGMAFRFPGASDAGTFWGNLRDGVESITRFSAAELIAAGTPPALLARPGYVPARGILGGVEDFDAAFFDFTPREAEIMDPQHRLLLECAWEAVERAGYDPDRPPGAIGLFAGVNTATYFLNLLADPTLHESLGRMQMEIGNEKDHLASQISYRLNLHGPSLTVQTGCSTSLVAVHLAVQSLLGYECDMALAGGASLSLPQIQGYLHQEGNVLSPDGHCRAFDQRARGTVNGSGAAMVVLKRLEDARAAGDTVHAVIKGTAVNNDGARKVGYSAPSVAGQAEVIAQALAMARLAARDISYVEAHGTGTPLGDPIEMAALKQAFAAAGGGAAGSCAVGSVKTNLGHLNTAAGLAGLIKTVLMLGHRQLAPSLHFERLNPAIDLAGSPFYVNAELRPWPAGEGPRRAGVSSFSIGGTNAHVILEEAPAVAPRTAGDGALQLLVLSAKTPRALSETAARLAARLGRAPDLDLADAAFTLQTGRKALPYRRALVGRTAAEIATALLAGASPGPAAACEGRHRPVAFLFPGQGTQYPGMGEGLYRGQPTFRREVDRCVEILAPHLGRDLRRLLFSAPAPDEAADASRELAETALAQPALFVHEHALARLWMSWGVHPEVMLGHSVGELVAACLAGVFSLEDALALVAERGRLMAALPPGAMLAVALGEADLAPRLGGALDLAAVNGSAASVVAGTAEAVAALEEQLTREGTAVRRLPVTRAFHSRQVEPAISPFVRQVAAVRRHPPRLPWISNVTGDRIGDQEAVDPDYWGRQLRHTVRFSAGLAAVLAEPSRVLLEVGPGDTLTRLAGRHPGHGAGRVSAAMSSRGSREPGEEERALLETLGRLWTAGVTVDWPALHAGRARRRVELPTYPFERRRFWIDGGAAPPAPAGPAAPAAAGREPAATVGGGAHARPDLPTAYLPPANPVEAEIADSLQQLLGLERVGRHDDFFALGGHSLLAVQLINRLRGRFQIDLRLSTLFEAPTVSGLAARIAEARLDSLGDSREIQALSPAELREAIAREAGLPGAEVGTQTAVAAPLPQGAADRTMSFSLMFFSSDGSRGEADKYRLLLDCARFADRHGFEAVWTPERHFQEFGGLYPNPSILSAALAMVTERVEIRAGSLVLPLHHPIRVAEDWLLLDNLSGGRVGLALASGWHPSDFALAPAAYAERRHLLDAGIATIRQIWTEGTITTPRVDGGEIEVRVFPRPLRPALPLWITTSATLATWTKAGEIGANVLCGLHGEPEGELTRRIEHYRHVRREHGHDPEAGRVTVMLHTFLGPDLDAVRETVREPMVRYLKTFIAQGKDSLDAASLGIDPAAFSDRDQEDLAAFAFTGYFDTRSLLGTPESCASLIRRLQDAGVDEVACLLDFGLARETVLVGLPFLDRLRREGGNPKSPLPPAPPSIPRRAGTGPAPLTHEQERFWAVQQTFPACNAYNINNETHFEGVNVSALRAALGEIVRRHEILRTLFVARDGVPWQAVQPAAAPALPLVDLSALPADLQRLERRRTTVLPVQRPFDLAVEVPLRLLLLRLAANRHVLIRTFHHIATDWWSSNLFRHELATLYRAAVEGRPPVLPELAIQYADFAVWQRAWLPREIAERGLLAHWRQRLDGAPPEIALPRDRPRPPVATFKGARLAFLLPPETAAGLRALARREEVTLFVPLLAAFAALLSRISPQDDFVIGSPVANRSHPEIGQLLGYFLNYLLMRIGVAAGCSFQQLHAHTRGVVHDAYAHQDLPCGLLLQESRLERRLDRAPLSQVAFIFLTVAEPRTAEEKTEAGVFDPGTSRVDLTLVAESMPQGEIRAFWEYSTDLFDRTTMSRLAGHLQSLLAGIVSDPAAPVSALAVLSAAERHALLCEWNDRHPAACVLDAALEPCPIGVPGDLYVGGEGRRLHRTGDRARYTADGTLELLGRPRTTEVLT